jgi:LEA14-like dessication related protein
MQQTTTTNTATTSGSTTALAATVAPIDIKVKDIVANKSSTTDRNKNAANLRIAFDIHNPNANTMILDGIHYNVYVNNVLITSGNIGTEAPEDVLRSQQGFPIIGNSALTLKDTQAIIQQSNINAIIWDKILQGKASYIVKGTYYFRQTANPQASGGANEFNLAFP